MDKNYDGSVTIDEFLDVFLQAEEILSSKIKKADSNIASYEKEIRDVQAG